MLSKYNPITASVMFDKRVKEFITRVICSSLQPIGDILDYFYRVEFQQRGAPHIHCLFWVKNAPRLDDDSDEEVLHFIDKYIKFNIPKDNPELKTIVESVQMHRKTQSKSCEKGKKRMQILFSETASSRIIYSKTKCRRKYRYTGRIRLQCTKFKV